MSPVSDMRKLSLMPDSVVRSQSDSSYESLATVMMDKRARRATEWATGVLHNDRKMVLRPLQINGLDQKEFSSLLYRRLSKVKPSSQTTPETPAGVSRSYSVKSVKKLAEARQRNRGSSIPTEGTRSGGVKVKERTISNRSLPLPGDESEYLRLRNFSVTSKGVINRGDSFRSKSSSSIPSIVNVNNEDSEAAAKTKESKTEIPSPLREDAKVVENQRKFKVLLIGGPGVGKTSMRKQFMTSEYICAYDSQSELDMDPSINIVLNNEESHIEFDEETWMDNCVYYTKPDCSHPDAFVLVYSVTDRRSFSQAKKPPIATRVLRGHQSGHPGGKQDGPRQAQDRHNRRRTIPRERAGLQVHRDLRRHQPPGGRAARRDPDTDPNQTEGGREAQEEEGVPGNQHQEVLHLQRIEGVGGAEENSEASLPQIQIL